MNRHVSVLLWKEGDCHVSRCPATSVSSYGDTEKEALDHHGEAMELFFEDMSEEEIKDILESMPPADAKVVKVALQG